MLARDNSRCSKMEWWAWCAVLQNFVRERNQCLVLSLYKAIRAGSLGSFSWGAWTGGEQQEVTAVSSVALKTPGAPGAVGRSEPSLPLSSRKAGPPCCKGSCWCCSLLHVAKAPWAAWLHLCSWKLLAGAFWSCPGTGSVWVVSFSGSLLSLDTRQWEIPISPLFGVSFSLSTERAKMTFACAFLLKDWDGWCYLDVFCGAFHYKMPRFSRAKDVAGLAAHEANPSVALKLQN